MEIKHNKSESRGQFEAHENGKEAGKMLYSTRGKDVIVIEHTEVDPEFQGQGVGKQMVDKAVEYARENDIKISSECSYARKVLGRSSEYEDVLA